MIVTILAVAYGLAAIIIGFLIWLIVPSRRSSYPMKIFSVVVVSLMAWSYMWNVHWLDYFIDRGLSSNVVVAMAIIPLIALFVILTVLLVYEIVCRKRLQKRRIVMYNVIGKQLKEIKKTHIYKPTDKEMWRDFIFHGVWDEYDYWDYIKATMKKEYMNNEINNSNMNPVRKLIEKQLEAHDRIFNYMELVRWLCVFK